MLVLSSVSYPLNRLKLLSKFDRLTDGDKLDASEGAFKRILLVYDFMAAAEFLEQSGLISCGNGVCVSLAFGFSVAVLSTMLRLSW